MNQITMNGFAYCEPAEVYEHGQPNVRDGFTYRYSAHSTKNIGDRYINAGTATLTITLPDGFDPRKGAVDALEVQKRLLMAEFQKRITEIDKQISQFTALEFVEAE